MDREQWLKERQKGLGGTDSAIVLGVSRFHEPEAGRDWLWARKLNFVPEIEQIGIMERGLDLEPNIHKKYVKETGRAVTEGPGLVRHPRYNWMIANADRLQYKNGQEDTGILELKSMNPQVYERFELHGPEDGYIVQVQQYMAVLGLSWATICALDVVNWVISWYDIKRDDELIDIIIREGQAFWDHVVTKVRPPSETPVVIVEKEKPKVATIESNDWAHTAKKYIEAKSIKGAVEALLKECENRLAGILSDHDAQAGEGAGLRVHYKLEEGRKSLDRIALVADYPDLDLEKYTKKGPQKFVFRSYKIKGNKK
jgi:putative phage-type endonuclease